MDVGLCGSGSSGSSMCKKVLPPTDMDNELRSDASNDWSPLPANRPPDSPWNELDDDFAMDGNNNLVPWSWRARLAEQHGNNDLLTKATLKIQARESRRLAWEAKLDSKDIEKENVNLEFMGPLQYPSYFPYPMYDPGSAWTTNWPERYNTWFDMWEDNERIHMTRQDGSSIGYPKTGHEISFKEAMHTMLFDMRLAMEESCLRIQEALAYHKMTMDSEIGLDHNLLLRDIRIMVPCKSFLQNVLHKAILRLMEMKRLLNDILQHADIASSCTFQPMRYRKFLNNCKHFYFVEVLKAVGIAETYLRPCLGPSTDPGWIVMGVDVGL
jgi:hypothetical protein